MPESNGPKGRCALFASALRGEMLPRGCSITEPELRFHRQGAARTAGQTSHSWAAWRSAATGSSQVGMNSCAT